MADVVDIRVAGVDVRVHALFPRLRRMCADYVVDGDFSPELELWVGPEDIERERAACEPGTAWSDAYLETLAVLRMLGCALPERDRLLVHGAVLEHEGRAYLFTAPSGVGKSTHLGLWRRRLGEAVRVVNGDKPFVWVPADRDAAVIAYGTPWCGKEGWHHDVAVPLAGICFLRRAEPGASSIRALEPGDALERAFAQVLLPATERGAARALELLDGLLTRVALHDLAVDMSYEAVEVAYRALVGREPPPIE